MAGRTSKAPRAPGLRFVMPCHDSVLARYYATTPRRGTGPDAVPPRRLAQRRTPTRSSTPSWRSTIATKRPRFLRDLCTLGELRDLAQRWAVVRLLDGRAPLLGDLAPHGRQHGDDHPDRVVAAPRRGRLRAGARARPAARGTVYPEAPVHRPDASAMSERRMTLAVPNKGRLVEPTLALLHDAGPRLRGARPEPREPRRERRPRHPLRPHERRRRVRPRRGRRPRGSPAATSSPSRRSTCRVVRSLGYGRCRLAAAVPSDSAGRAIEDLAGLRVATSHPRADAPLVRRTLARRRGDPALGRRRGRAAAGARRGDRRPRLDRRDARHERPATDRRPPRLRGDPRRQPGGAPRSGPTTSTASTRCSAPCSRAAAGST